MGGSKNVQQLKYHTQVSSLPFLKVNKIIGFALDFSIVPILNEYNPRQIHTCYKNNIKLDKIHVYMYTYTNQRTRSHCLICTYLLCVHVHIYYVCMYICIMILFVKLFIYTYQQKVHKVDLLISASLYNSYILYQLRQLAVSLQGPASS